MKIKLLILFFVIALFFSIVEVQAGEGEVSKSTVDDQFSMEVAVYNNNIASSKIRVK